MRHSVRLVDLSRRAKSSSIGETEAMAYRVGLRGAWLIYEHFPAFYQESCMDAMEITLPRLLGCCAAFWQLVEAKGLELCWPGEGGGFWEQGLTRYEVAETPAETVVMFDGVAPGWMAEFGGYIAAPNPAYHGYGVHALLDHEDDNFPTEVLTILLWSLFQHTPLGLGVPLLPMAANIEEDLAFDTLRIKPLPRHTPMQLLWQHLKLPIAEAHGVSAADLAAYAFGKTGNPLADYNEYEVQAIYMGEPNEEFDWADLDRLITLQREAQKLEAAYIAWGEQVTTIGGVRKLAGQFHKAARTAEAELQEAPKSLLTLLGHERLEAAARQLPAPEDRIDALGQHYEEVAV